MSAFNNELHLLTLATIDTTATNFYASSPTPAIAAPQRQSRPHECRLKLPPRRRPPRPRDRTTQPRPPQIIRNPTELLRPIHPLIRRTNYTDEVPSVHSTIPTNRFDDQMRLTATRWTTAICSSISRKIVIRIGKWITYLRCARRELQIDI